MADEGQIVRGINWQETLPFIHIFRAFRIAIHPSKLFLGLLLLVVLMIGGRILDALWPYRSRALVGEIAVYVEAGPAGMDLDRWRADTLAADDQAYTQLLIDQKIDTDRDQAAADALKRNHKSELRDKINSDLNDTTLKDLDQARQTAIDAANRVHDAQAASPDVDRQRDDALAAAKAMYTDGRRAAYADAASKLDRLDLYSNIGLSEAFIDYEVHQVTRTVHAAIQNSWFGPAGALESVDNFLVAGPIWMVRYHTIYFILFGLWFLAVWSVFGGAIARVAAVHVARDEKVSIRQAFNFSAGKFLSFASAPVIPMLIVIFVGFTVTLTAMALAWIPFLGPILIGLFFFLALIAGCIMTFVLLGTAGGFNLMYPTVAVEGSDSFDAISRSFSYVYARPWRMLFYTVVALIYGAACYLFVHLFLWLMLLLTHHFASMGMFYAHAPSTEALMPAMWPDPAETGRLTYSLSTHGLRWDQAIGAELISLWVYLVVGLLGGFAISFYFSVNTVIYFLMRSEVDATEMDDVYLERSEEMFGEPAPGGTPSPSDAVTMPPSDSGAPAAGA
jgi:hypothetical protein